jgi:hypothetical protein
MKFISSVLLVLVVCPAYARQEFVPVVTIFNSSWDYRSGEKSMKDVYRRGASEIAAGMYGGRNGELLTARIEYSLGIPRNFLIGKVVFKIGTKEQIAAYVARSKRFFLVIEVYDGIYDYSKDPDFIGTSQRQNCDQLLDSSSAG